MKYIVDLKLEIPGEVIKEALGFRPPALLAQFGLKKMIKKYEEDLAEEIPGLKILDLKVKKTNQ